MKKSQILTMALCATVATAIVAVRAAGTLPSNAANLVANSGLTFVLSPTADPTVFTITADEVVQVSIMGNCSEHAELTVRFPTSPGQPVVLSGSGTITSSDGANSLRIDVAGTATPDPANPSFFNNTYKVTVSGGSGAFASASGAATINETVQFNSTFTGGTGTWTMKGYVVSAH